MIGESYVSFETARLLKEAGFDVECYWFYINDGSANTGIVVRSTSPRDHNMGTGFLSRPTLALAARWLREVHGLHVYAFQTNLPLTEPQTDKWEWGYVIDKVNDPNSNVANCEMYFDSYEAAFEAGLQEAIKLIKK